MATDKLLARYGAHEILRRLTVTPAVLKRGAPPGLDATREDERLSICFDAFQRTLGPSPLGDFHYIPVLFHDTERPAHVQRRSLLTLYGLILGPLQRRTPGSGLLIYGQACEVRRVLLSAQARQARRVLQELRDLQTGTLPQLRLNNHCPLCAFCQRGHAEARAKDDLSLLRGLSAKEITR